jgi:tetratricopeptide (TPR) repeat protein
MLAIVIACLLWGHGLVGAIQNDVARAKDVYTRAIALEARGNHAAALPLLWEAAELAPHDADIQNRLGEALERIGALDAAIDAYRLALTERPSFKKASNNLILALVKNGKGDEAVNRARALVAAAPDDPERSFTLGLAQSDVDISGAIDSFRRVLELDSRHVLARYNLALVLYRADRLPAAIEELQRTLAIEARPEAHYTLGVIYWHEGNLDRSVDALRAAVAAQPDYVDAHVTLGAVLRAKRDWKGAVSALRRAVALRPDLTAAHYTLAQALQSKGDEEDARAEFAEAERLRRLGEKSQEAGVWTAVGAQKLGGGDAAGALDFFRRATAALETYAPAHYQMGLALQRLGQHDAARAAFTRAQQLNPGLVPPDVRKD